MKRLTWLRVLALNSDCTPADLKEVLMSPITLPWITVAVLDKSRPPGPTHDAITMCPLEKPLYSRSLACFPRSANECGLPNTACMGGFFSL